MEPQFSNKVLRRPLKSFLRSLRKFIKYSIFYVDSKLETNKDTRPQIILFRPSCNILYSEFFSKQRMQVIFFLIKYKNILMYEWSYLFIDLIYMLYINIM